MRALGSVGLVTTGSMLSSVKPRSAMWKMSLVKSVLVVGVGAAHVIVLVAALFHELLELRHDGVIAAVACVVLAEAVMDFLAAIEAQHDIVALLVAEVDDIVVDEHTVGGHGEAEVLVVDPSPARGSRRRAF